jgi:hypothetical protein
MGIAELFTSFCRRQIHVAEAAYLAMIDYFVFPYRPTHQLSFHSVFEARL